MAVEMWLQPQPKGRRRGLVPSLHIHPEGEPVRPGDVSCLDITCLGINTGDVMSKPPSLLEDHLGYWLRRLSNRVHRGFAERLEGRGVTVAQWVVLRCLYDVEETPLHALAATVGVDGGAMSRMVDRLVQKGLVVREPDPADRRATRLRLSEPGRQLVPLLAREADENDAAFFDGLGEAGRRRLLATVRKLLAGDAGGGKTLD